MFSYVRTKQSADIITLYHKGRFVSIYQFAYNCTHLRERCIYTAHKTFGSSTSQTTQAGPITARRIAHARIYLWFRLCRNPDCASLTLKKCVSYACHSCSLLSGLNYKKHAGLIAQFTYALSCLSCTCMRFYSRQMHGQWVMRRLCMSEVHFNNAG